jgi:2-amino-4-hydroxy-6-hydroxymethyldihydropteridine diphosphokinase
VYFWTYCHKGKLIFSIESQFIKGITKNFLDENMNTAIISAGSNINPEANLKKAQAILQKEQRLVAFAKPRTTKPLGFADQPDFLNTVYLIETDLDMLSLTSFCKAVEHRLGRVRTPNKFGPRTIDLDIAVFNGRVTDNDIYDRDFLHDLILEVAPEMKNELCKK